jgi:hypothetical protein
MNFNGQAESRKVSASTGENRTAVHLVSRQFLGGDSGMLYIYE